MAYIKSIDEDSETGMNVLGTDTQTEPTQEASNSSQIVSGGQSSAIGSGQSANASQTANNASQAPTKKASSGMFTNVKKYIDQNKAGAQNMSNKLQSNVANQNASIKSAIEKQQTDFTSRVNQNRSRLENAQQFGNQAINQAATQQNTAYEQQQQANLQNTVDSLGNVADQTQTITQNQADITKQQQAYDQAQQQAQQAQTQYDQIASDYQQGLGEVYSYNQAFSGNPNMGTAKTGYNQGSQLTSDQINQMISSGDFESLERNILSNNGQFIEKAVNQRNIDVTPEVTAEQQASLDELQQLKDTFNTVQQSKTQADSSLNALEGIRKELKVNEETQRLYENKQITQSELDTLTEKINNAPEALTDEDVERFQNLTNGIERFDDAILNLTSEQSQVDDLQMQADSLGTSLGRRELMREEFGKQGGYTAGQSALDNLILTGNQEAVTSLVNNAQAQAAEVSSQLETAFKEGRITQDEMTNATNQLQEELKTQLETAMVDLETSLQDRATTGEGTVIGDLLDRINNGEGISGLTAEELEILGMSGNEVYSTGVADALGQMQIDPTQFSISDIANATDLERAQALARLSGEESTDNIFLNNTLGIDALNKERILNRGVLAEGEKGTGTTLSELGAADIAALREFQSNLGPLEYESADAAAASVKTNIQNLGNQIIKGQPLLYHIEDSIYDLATKGTMESWGKTYTLQDYIDNPSKVLRQLGQDNYWGYVGQTGIHGNSSEPAGDMNVIKQAIDQAIADVGNIRTVYSGDSDKSITSATADTYTSQDRIKELLG